MTSDTLYIKRPCGEGTNPKVSGEHFTIEEESQHCAFYNADHKKWYEYEPLDHVILGDALYPEEVYPTYWLEPFTTIEHIQEEAFSSAYKLVINALSSMKWNKEDDEALKNAFSDFRKDYLKRNGGE